MSDQGGATGPDLGAIFSAHVAYEFDSRDVDATMATMATMTDDPYVTHVPTLAGGVGAEEVRRFYDDHFIGHWPDDVSIAQVSRTIGADRVVDEMVMNFVHDRVMDTFLPGVAPTGRTVSLPVVAVVGFEDGKVAYERIYWDQASLLVQVGILDPSALPVSGAEQAAKVLDKDRSPMRSAQRSTPSSGSGERCATWPGSHSTLSCPSGQPVATVSRTSTSRTPWSSSTKAGECSPCSGWSPLPGAAGPKLFLPVPIRPAPA